MPENACANTHHESVELPPTVGAICLARAARMLSAAGDPARLGLLELLDSRELCVTDIATLTGDSMPAVSQRLRVLKAEGLVRSRRDGKHIFYALADDHVRDLVANVLRHAAESPSR